MEFSLDAFFNPHLAVGVRRIDAVLSAKVEGSPSGQAGVGKAICFLIDVSGSMQTELRDAKIAARRCIDLLDPTTHFCVIAFNDTANAIVPMGPTNASRKSSAHNAIQNLGAGGGTCFSRALDCARQQFASSTGTVNAAMLLTDGENDSGDAAALAQAIANIDGSFQCDCRGLGSGWRPDQLRQIANALAGNADACVHADQIEADFKGFLARVMGKVTSDARLKIWTPKVARLISIKQMSPEIIDITTRGRRIDDKTTEFSLGSWGSETRDYHVAIELPAGSAGDEMMACRASISVRQNGQETSVSAPNVVATWSLDNSLTTRINAQVAHYTGQTELADSIREGLAALDARKIDEATRQLGKAAKIAHASGNDEVTARLRKVVDIVDADAGTVRIKAGVAKGDTLELDMGGTRTVRRRVGVAAETAKP